ncbi:Gfo/Idh/MocA family oxidoreductase [Mesorhizobium sp. M4A.F.Ca.ET.022.05.2.1]|uniref:Gfo/Idh/MocA family protein n=1 Tax=Mesorhizobium sp. M4A.F.Ca.ET.022.05.2.1 TaxID=2496653 RepID=UPI0016750B4C|nr:Gfo/Idh/MocA family oxidoreductase [Mesorhizobium sp. M4A.F.Ca.ET.022.05.2.1]
MNEKVVSWGLIGASTIAREWMVDSIRKHPLGRVKATVSSDLSRAQAFSDQMGIPDAYDSLEPMLSDREIDAVYISTKNDQHLSQALAAIEAGKHVLCEKPLALEPKDAQSIVEAAERKGVVLATNHHLRNMESHRAIKRLLREGAIGKINSIRIFHAGSLPQSLKTWRLFEKAAGAGVIYDITVHDADLLRFYLESNPTKITALATSSGEGASGIEDSVMSVWEFPGNILVQCHDSFVVGYGPRGVEIHGSAGSILGIDVMSQAPGGRVVLSTSDGEQDIPLELKVTYDRGVSDFMAAMQRKGRPSSTGEDGVWSVKLAKAVGQSAATGQTVLIEQV